MQNEPVNIRRRRVSDFPERQVGFPERNDASSPYHDMERLHVDLETMGVSRKSAAQLTRELKEPRVR